MSTHDFEPPLILRLFGALEVRHHGQPLPRMRTRKEQWLLALLALRQGRDLDRGWLAGTLWPESTQSQALHNLRRSLSDLRTSLGEDADCLVSLTPGTICLAVSGFDVDVTEFDAAVRRGDPPSLERAIALYEGPLLQGCTEEWVVPERDIRERAYIGALETLAVQAMARGDSTTAAGYLRLAVDVDPLHETAQCALMEALAAGGDHAGVTRAYHAFRLHLHRELNSAPAAETVEFYQRLWTQGRCQVLRPTPTPRRAGPTHRLPQPLNRLIGRESARKEIIYELSTARLVTLIGMGGVGKTRLALSTADHVSDAYPHGVWFVDLAVLSDPARVPHTVCRALDVREKAGRPPVETLVEVLQAESRLLVLDNCEHLLDACAALVQTLIENCPRLWVLATSRQSLGIPGERVYPVPALAVPAHYPLDKELSSRLNEVDSIQLFVERARQFSPAFRATPQNLRAIARIVTHLDGLPLAIELAAARTSALPPEQMQVRLNESLRLLNRGKRTAAPRHQTLKSAIDWSYNLLSEAERTLLGRLSLFVGGWTLDAVEAVCAGDGLDIHEVLDLLSLLVEKSLVVYAERNGEARYDLLVTIRLYGAEKLAERGDAAPTQIRHARYFLALAEEADPFLNHPEQRSWLMVLETEHENLRAALDWFKTDPERTEEGLRMAGALRGIWGILGLREGQKTLTHLLSRNTEAGRPAVRVKALLTAGNLAYLQADYAAARAFHEESLTLRTQSGDRVGAAAELGYLGLIAFQQDDFGTARALLQESLATLEGLGDKTGVARLLQNLGSVLHLQGAHVEARTLLECCAAMNRAQGNRGALSITLNTLGLLALEMDDLSRSRTYLEESLTLDAEFGTLGHRLSLSGLGLLAVKEGEYARAQELLEEELTLRRDMRHRQSEAYALYNLARLRHAQNDDESALYRESLSLFQEIGHKLGIAFCLEGFVRLALNRPERAARLWAGAQAIRERSGAPAPLDEREEQQRQEAEIRSALGARPFAVAWSEGRSLTLEQIVAYALDDTL